LFFYKHIFIIEKNTFFILEVIFDFDDCYRECLDNLERLGYGCRYNENGKLVIRQNDVEITTDKGCETAASERRAV